MPDKLIVSVVLKDAILQQHSFDDGVCRIGRQNDCDLVLDNPAISREHAELTCQPEGWFLRDLSSANGSFLNSRQTFFNELRDGDVVTIGKFQLHIALTAAEGANPDSSLSGRDQTIRAPSKNKSASKSPR